MSQITKNILMIKPSSFGFNNDTSGDNYFQKQINHLRQSEIRLKAVEAVSYTHLTLPTKA